MTKDREIRGALGTIGECRGKIGTKQNWMKDEKHFWMGLRGRKEGKK